jgi:hypothetical protein
MNRKVRLGLKELHGNFAHVHASRRFNTGSFAEVEICSNLLALKYLTLGTNTSNFDGAGGVGAAHLVFLRDAPATT